MVWENSTDKELFDQAYEALVNSFWLSKKAGKEVYLEPITEGGKVRFEVRHGKGNVHDGTFPM